MGMEMDPTDNHSELGVPAGTGRPRTGFYIDEGQALAALDRIARLPWASRAFAKLQRQGEEALELDDGELLQLVLGMRDQAFAYGIAGCPACRKPFPPEEEAQQGMFSPMADWRRKRMTCPSCGRCFPDEEYPDGGEGFLLHGQGYYPVGMWNFHYAAKLLGGPRDHEGLVSRLVTLYILTGDERYARKALTILDAFSAIFADTIGPRDFSAFGSGFEIGRLHLLTSIVHRIKVWLASDYDWLAGLPLMEEPSPALRRLGRSGTVRSNVEAMLNDYMLEEAGGPDYHLGGGRLTSLNNHEADGIRSMLAVGLALGRREYLQWGLTAWDALLHNTIGRDGMYFEGSFGYGLFTGTIFLDIAYLAIKARRMLEQERERAMEQVMEQQGRELAGPPMPPYRNPFDSRRFYRFLVENPLELLCQGHLPCCGDSSPDKETGCGIDRKLLLQLYRAAVMFRQFGDDPGIRDLAEETAVWLLPLAGEELGGTCFDWFMEHPEEERAATDQPGRQACARGTGVPYTQGSTVRGGAGYAVLRDRSDTTLIFRIGPNVTHSHDDVLAYGLYSGGQAVSADLGYGVYGSNGHFGWASKAAAHQTVVVNEDEGLAAGQIYKLYGGGAFTALYESDLLSAAEGDATGLYFEGGSGGLYRRLLAVVSAGGGAGGAVMSYTADFFAVLGARTTDYIYRAFHGAAELRLPDAQPEEEDRPGGAWTLAGLDQDAGRRQYFDAPGLSPGERLTTGETLEPLLEGERKLLWTPEPNNGYGYVFGVRRVRPALRSGGRHSFRAVWKQPGGGWSLAWHGCPDLEDRIYTALCPNLDGSARHRVLIVRDAAPRKLYAAFVQVQAAESPGGGITVEPLAAGIGWQEEAGTWATSAEGGERPAVKAAAVRLPDGSADYWLYSSEDGRYQVETPAGTWLVEGRCALLRLDPSGQPADWAAIAAETMMLGDRRLPVATKKRLRVKHADYEAERITVEGACEPEPFRNLYIRYRGSEGDPGAIYEVSGQDSLASGTLVLTLRDSLTLSIGVVESCGDNGEIRSAYPLPLGISHLHEQVGPTVFTGRLLLGVRGGRARILRLTGLKTIHAHIETPFEKGERFRIVEIEAGGFVEAVPARQIPPNPQED